MWLGWVPPSRAGWDHGTFLGLATMGWGFWHEWSCFDHAVLGVVGGMLPDAGLSLNPAGHGALLQGLEMPIPKHPALRLDLVY